jgi:hypothetical protein
VTRSRGRPETDARLPTCLLTRVVSDRTERGTRLSALVDDASPEKIARNNAVFRDANEAIAVAASRHGFDDGRVVPFICECSDRGCTKVIRLTLSQYRSIRDNPRRFAHAKGHEAAISGSVQLVEECDDFAVVEKTGEAGDMAARLASDIPNG